VRIGQEVQALPRQVRVGRQAQAPGGAVRREIVATAGGRPGRWREAMADDYHSSPRSSYSLEGSDLIIASLLRNVAQGRYIDVGANHPIIHSNTRYFYERGWRGLAVDGNREFETQWLEHRPNDIFVSALVSDQIKDVEFFVYPDRTMSTIESDSIARYASRYGQQQIQKEARRTTTLFDLKNQYLKQDEIHLLSVDVEGEDLNCLVGAKLDRWTPGVIVVETKHLSVYRCLENDIVSYLTTLGYRLIAKAPLDAFFVFPTKPYLDWIPTTII
jgi:FkbM family methyltransferase